MRKHLLLIGLSLTLLFWLLNFIALTFYLYWTTGWYDYMMHFLGGLTVGVLVIWTFNIKNKSPLSFLVVFISVLVVGGGWEVFEYVNDITFSTEGYTLDTIHDLIMDSLGAVVAYRVSTSKSQELP